MALDKLRAVLGVSRALIEIADETELLELVARSTCTYLGFGRCFVFVREADDAFHIRASYALANVDPVEVSPSYSIPGAIYEIISANAERIGEVLWVDGRSAVISDSRVAPHIIPTPATAKESTSWHSASLLFAPLLGRDGEVVGLLGPDDPLDGQLPSGDSALVLETFAHLSSVALQLIRARNNATAQLRILEAQRQQVARLFEASTTVKREIQLDDMLSGIARTMAEAGGFARVALMLLDPGSSLLKIRATYGLSDKEVDHLSTHQLDLADFAPMMQPEMMISRSFLYDHSKFQVPQTLLESLSIPSPARDWRPGMWHPLDSLNIPLYDSDRKLLGIVSIDEPTNGYFPELYHVQALEFFADQCATAVSQVILYRQLEVIAETDALTRLPNRGTFSTRMIEALEASAARGEPASLLFMDLDHFKRINDTHGHLNGDLVLKSIARRLRSSVRKVDLLARFGGEEFVLFLGGTDLEAALSIAEKLRSRIESHFIALQDGLRVRTTISIGTASTSSLDLSVVKDSAALAETLLFHADNALYDAKASGRNRVSCAIDSLGSRTEAQRLPKHTHPRVDLNHFGAFRPH